MTNHIVYNEIDAFTASWLRNLINQNLIERGEVIETDVLRLHPDQLRKVRQFHAFAGIGVWSYALRLAHWPTNIQVWTGSCPCQPFSIAGRGRGEKDERHLWPAWYSLIRECRPSVVFGEQVASPLGRRWFRSVQDDLEALGYQTGAADLCAASVGAPHRRQRLFFVAYTGSEGLAQRLRQSLDDVEEFSAVERGRRLSVGTLGDSGRKRSNTRAGQGDRGFWNEVEWLPCRDGKARPVEPGTFPLAHGIAGRMAIRLPGGGKRLISRTKALKGIGNSLVPQVAAAFIKAFLGSVQFKGCPDK